MANWDLLDWHRTFNKTQKYLLSRLAGSDCGRDQVEAWRQFYQTHEPIVRMAVRQQGLHGIRFEQCVRDVWLDLLTGLPKLRRTSTREFFQCWLQQLVLAKVALRRLCSAGKDSPEIPATVDAASSASSQSPVPRAVDPSEADRLVESSLARRARLNSQLFQLRVVEEQSVSDVARALGLTSSQVRHRHQRMLEKLLAVLIQLDT